MGSFIAARMVDAGHRVWATCTSAEKARQLEALGLAATVVDFDRRADFPELGRDAFDLAIVSVPGTH